MPTEGLYAEALRRPGLVEALQREHRVTLAGPTTLLATLTSLQMGFRTLALEKRSAEVWEVLGAVKTEFGKFGDVLAKTKKKLDEASNTIDAAEVRTRAMARSLREVEAVPEERAQALLPGGRPTTDPSRSRWCCRPRKSRSRMLDRVSAPARTLLALIIGQICLHSCMAGVRMAAPLLALRQGHAGVGGRRAAGLVRAPRRSCSRCAAGRLADRHGYHRPMRDRRRPDGGRRPAGRGCDRASTTASSSPSARRHADRRRRERRPDRDPAQRRARRA